MKQKIEIFLLRMISKLPQYRAFILATWFEYKHSELFRQRWLAFNQIEAAKLYRFSEHKHFQTKVLDNKELMNQIIWQPYTILNEVTDWDKDLLGYVTLE
jgi:hypothetical protein